MAAEHLTEQERGYVLAHFDEEEREIGDCVLVEDVERIVARRLSEQAEQIAQAIEEAATAADVDMVEIHGAFVRRTPYAAEHLREAARIALDHKEDRHA